MALVPQLIWPDKPVFAGGGNIIVDMTGLSLERKNTAWGVGNVMEYYINFGMPGLIIGFVLFGFLIARLDSCAARALASRDYGGALVYFLPAVALIQPLGALVDLSSGAVAALLAGFAWRWIWMHASWSNQRLTLRPISGTGELGEEGQSLSFGTRSPPASS